MKNAPSHLPQNLHQGPYALRATLVTARSSGSFLHEPDGILEVDATGKIAWVGPAAEYKGTTPVTDVRPLWLLPGMIDLHGHLPQFPMTGLNDYGRELMPWLVDVMAPTERKFTGARSRERSLEYLSLFAASGTTTPVLYGSVDAEATDEAFAVAAENGFRLLLGQCLMDRYRYDSAIPDSEVTDKRLEQSDALCRKWNGHDDGRLLYVFTPRFAPSCSREMMRESASLAKKHDAYWQTHLSETPGEMVTIQEMFPECRNYLDIYEKAGGLGRKSIFAHCVYLSTEELDLMKQTGCVLAHCPSNVLNPAGVMDLGRYVNLDMRVGLASDVGGCYDISLFQAISLGWVCQSVRFKLGVSKEVVLSLERWLELATLSGARALGLEDKIGSLEAGKEADMFLADVQSLRLTDGFEDKWFEQLLTLLVFRYRPGVVRATWIRGRAVPGPGIFEAPERQFRFSSARPSLG
jgi:guanine deaminase